MSVASERRPAAIRRDGVIWQREFKLRPHKCERLTIGGKHWSCFSGPAAAACVHSTMSPPFRPPLETATPVMCGRHAVQSSRKLPGLNVQGG
jgi:hypothetical protein